MECQQISRPVSVVTHESASQDVPMQDQDLVDFDFFSSQIKVIFDDFDKKVSSLAAFKIQIVSHGGQNGARCIRCVVESFSYRIPLPSLSAMCSRYVLFWTPLSRLPADRPLYQQCRSVQSRCLSLFCKLIGKRTKLSNIIYQGYV